ncbi:metalloregulator ArsR/SmtB family transcription factor [Hoeflea sp. YIM 152468]|uniref:ArsR/SmtB family transcription factor n=1 Tax=Hoeflea sp. YIM 152468 TaxID=3031759 RepID=UPI0023DB7B62|nr:metalloregulator ArsR/SmtB family transcription factor [Hoeflea sp. YIM 152468]MDF1607766.1 metalloregulator ArsR/SmtB family transcription factor [Hoeflea sp. YIM 152468]
MKVSDPNNTSSDEAVARKLAALAHPARLRLLRYLGSADYCCVKELVDSVGLAQSTVSQHLKVLAEAGLVSFRAERQRSRYTVNADALRELACVIVQTLDHCCGSACSAERNETHTNHARQSDPTVL